MIISYKHGFVFLKTRKTAGSSIQAALYPVCGDEDIIVGDDVVAGKTMEKNIDRAFSRNPHVNLKQMRIAFTEQVWRSLFKFVFVRNPWALVVSRYHWERKGLGCSTEDFRAWLPAYADGDRGEPERNAQSNLVQGVWETAGGYRNDLQSPFVFEGEARGVQFVGRYEEISRDFGEVCRRLGIDPPPLPRLKGGFSRLDSYREAYDAPSRQLVRRAFAADIDHFGYVF